MSLLPFHIALMSAAALTMFSGIVAAHYFRKKKWWLKVHKTLNIASVVLALSGFAVAAAMVQASGGPHFRVTHAIFGIAGLFLLLSTPLMGFMIFRLKGKEKIARLKTVHRWLGRLTASMIAVSAIAGLVLVGIL